VAEIDKRAEAGLCCYLRWRCFIRKGIPTLPAGLHGTYCPNKVGKDSMLCDEHLKIVAHDQKDEDYDRRYKAKRRDYRKAALARKLRLPPVAHVGPTS
jgi:hypothetical protein